MTRSRAIIGTPSHDSVGFESATDFTPMRASSATLPMMFDDPRVQSFADRDAIFRQDVLVAHVELERQFVRRFVEQRDREE